MDQHTCSTERRGQDRVDDVPFWLGRARDLLHERCGSTVRMSVIAGDVGIHPVHLSRSFRRHFGVTMRAYLRDLRVRRACDELRRTEHSLSRIAIATGFADHAHFTRTFKGVHGLTPRDYRRRERRHAVDGDCAPPWSTLGAGE